MHMKAVYWRTATLGVEDVAVTTHDFWRDPDPNEAYADTVAAAFHGAWVDIGASIPSQVSLKELRFYFGYNFDRTPGEVDYIKSYSVPGLNTSGMLPPQCSCSVTEMVTTGGLSRRHWGRFYLPGLAKDRVTADGRWTSIGVNDVADAYEVMYDTLRDGTNGPVVGHLTPTVGAHSMVDSIRVDDIVDIIRRRRWDAVGLRVTKPVE
jgi:hypothetical protein